MKMESNICVRSPRKKAGVVARLFRLREILFRFLHQSVVLIRVTEPGRAVTAYPIRPGFFDLNARH